MKLILLITIFLSQLAFSQQADSIRKRAIDFQSRAWKAEVDKQFERCIVLADSSIALDGARSEPYVIKAECLWFLQRYGEAAATYKKWITVDSNKLLVGAYVLLGMLYDKAGMISQAKEQYTNAIKTYESDYQSPATFERTEEIEYAFAFGLLGDIKRWKEKLAEFIKKYPSSNYDQFQNMSRKELLEFHFSPFAGY